jgi:catechol 2,3-dioxygenase-like lactoylglutathione lyase family enzyme
MLRDFTISPTLPAADMARARQFYEKTLGLEVDLATDAGVRFRAKNSTLFVYPSTFAGTNKATAAGFETTDLATAVAELKGRGVKFEEYDMGEGFKTVNSIMTTPDGLAAWFKDTEGNVIGLFQNS